MGTIAEDQERLTALFNSFEDDLAKYSFLIEAGASLPPLPSEKKDDAHLVPGCQSNVWLDVSKEANGTIAIEAEADSFVVQGILAVIVDIFQGKTAEEIDGVEFTFLRDTGLAKMFSPERRNGVSSLITEIERQAAGNGLQ